MQGLESQLETFSSETRQSIRYAAKLATTSIITIRFGKSTVSNNKSASSSSTITANDSSMLERLNCVKKESSDWLELIEQHFKSTSTGSSSDSRVDAASLSDQHFDIVQELLLLSLELLKVSASSKSKSKSLDYSALIRNLILLALESLNIDTLFLERAEKSLSQTLYFQLQQLSSSSSSSPTSTLSSASASSHPPTSSSSKTFKYLTTGAGVILGGVALGITGGLAAPALIPLLGGIGITGFSGAGGAVLLGTLFGVGGGGLTGYRVNSRLKGIEEFKFVSIKDKDLPDIPSLGCKIVVSGFLLEEEDSVKPWRESFENCGKDVFSLKADTATFLAGGKALNTFVRDKIIRTGGTEIIKRSILAAVYAGIALPLTVMSSASLLLDGDFIRCHDKAKKAGNLLAEIIYKRVQGNRPVTLIGYGPGATTIFQSLLTLSTFSPSATYNLIDSIVLISLPISPSMTQWRQIRSLTSGRIVNCSSKNDWVLAIAARIFMLSAKPAGLGLYVESDNNSEERVEGVEDIDIGDLVEGGHLVLKEKIGIILESWSPLTSRLVLYVHYLH